MLKKLREHLTGNKGDANVSKMTLIAIIFVVGAILLVMTTSAFRGPINRWFDKVTDGWFAESNGMFEADNAFLGVEKNANGTYKGVRYICYSSDGSYSVLHGVEQAVNGRVDDFVLGTSDYTANGGYDGGSMYFEGDCTISDDGTAITIHGWTYVAQPPQ